MIQTDKMNQFYKTKQNMYDSVDDSKIAVYAACDINKDQAYKKFCCFETEKDFCDVLEKDNHLYEIIKNDRPMYSYFDLDGEIKKIQSLLRNMNIETDDIEMYVINEFKSLINSWKEDNDFPFNDDDYVILSGTNYKNAEHKVGGKFSLHIIDKTIKLKNFEDSKLYHSHMLKDLRERNDAEHTLLCCLIDDKVYSTDRLMRCVNQSKFKEGAKQLIFLQGNDFNNKDTLISIFDSKNDCYTKCPARWKRTRFKTLPVVSKKEEDVTDQEINEINILLDNINDDRFCDFEKWRNMLWCLYGCGMSVKDIHLQSSIRCPEKYNYEENQNKLNEFQSEKSFFTIDTLRKWAKIDTGFEVERHLQKTRKEQSKNKQEHFQFLDLLAKYQGKVFVNDVGIDDFCSDVSSCVSMILNSTTTFCTYSNDVDCFSLSRNIVKLCFYLKYEYDDGKQKTIPCNLESYMINNPLKFPLFNKIVFKPENKGLKKNELNICSYFQAQEINKEDIDMNIVNVFINHIKKVWASNNEIHYKYLMSWIAQVIKTPFKKTEVAILLQGGQGSGKTLPCDILLQYVFGLNLGLSSSGLQSLTQRFNGSSMGKIFTKVDELSIVSESFNSSFDKMKSLITDRNLQVEKKGLEHIQIENFNNFILTTNHRHTVKLERDDRRYACFTVSDSFKQNEDYFAFFMDKLDNQTAGNHIFTYFKNYPDEDMVNIRKIPKTELRDDLIECSKNNVERFINDMSEEFDHGLLFDWVGKNDEAAISSTNFYEYYKLWCTNVGEKSWSKKAVTTELINSKLFKYTGRSQYKNSRKYYYVF